METKFLQNNIDDIKTAGEILKNGGLVGIPTETVYGLAANALNSEAVEKIFKAKGRPQDNPLIVHISDLSEIDDLVSYVPPVVYELADAFWPGPLTIILEKSDLIPSVVSGGLDTVAIRMPSHPVARQIIKAAGVPLAAPSANTSGMPSPTTVEHVMHDMDGKIDAVLDGGPCEFGVESTVITLCTRKPRLLRPGGITPEELEEILCDLEIDKAVLSELEDNEVAASPGMKYKHYSPKAEVFVVEGNSEDFAEYVNTISKEEKGIFALVFTEDESLVNCEKISFGKKEDNLAHASKLFAALREFDELGAKKVYVHSPEYDGVGLAVMNRLLRSAGHKIIKL